MAFQSYISIPSFGPSSTWTCWWTSADFMLLMKVTFTVLFGHGEICYTCQACFKSLWIVGNCNRWWLWWLPFYRIRRAAEHNSADIDLAGHSRTTVHQEDIFGNPHIKEGFIKVVSACYQAAGIAMKQAVGESYTLIVIKGIHHIIERQSVVVIGIDTDLMLLAVRAPPNCNIYLVSSGQSKAQQ